MERFLGVDVGTYIILGIEWQLNVRESIKIYRYALVVKD